jgi:hypothetical protein
VTPAQSTALLDQVSAAVSEAVSALTVNQAVQEALDAYTGLPGGPVSPVEVTGSTYRVTAAFDPDEPLTVLVEAWVVLPPSGPVNITFLGPDVSQP